MSIPHSPRNRTGIHLKADTCLPSCSFASRFAARCAHRWLATACLLGLALPFSGGSAAAQDTLPTVSVSDAEAYEDGRFLNFEVIAVAGERRAGDGRSRNVGRDGQERDRLQGRVADGDLPGTQHGPAVGAGFPAQRPDVASRTRPSR